MALTRLTDRPPFSCLVCMYLESFPFLRWRCFDSLQLHIFSFHYTNSLCLLFLDRPPCTVSGTAQPCNSQKENRNHLPTTTLEEEAPTYQSESLSHTLLNTHIHTTGPCPRSRLPKYTHSFMSTFQSRDSHQIHPTSAFTPRQ